MDYTVCFENCPIEGALRIIGGKWTGSLLWHLLSQPLRFSDIQRHIPAASPKVLTQRLRVLENEGLIERHVLSVKPFAVEYRISEHGRSLTPIIQTLSDWGRLHATQRLDNSQADAENNVIY